jgi:2-keto-3-deoxy-L-arabinonate dehydratase
MDVPLAGVVPVVPTAFHDDESVDLDGTARVVEYLVDARVDGLCLLANYSEQFSLTDAERDEVARTLLEHVAGRLPVIVTTSHYSARVAAARSRAAQDMGAAMVMLMPPFFGATMTVAAPAVIGYFRQVAAAIDIPIMVQDAPLSPTPLPASLLVDLVRQVPRVQYAKIEVPQAADKLHALAGTCCRSSTSRTASAACARRRSCWPRAASSPRSGPARRWSQCRPEPGAA